MVDDGILAPDGPAWKALVLEATQKITSDTVTRLHNLALAGLPVIIAGEPGYYSRGSNCSEERFRAELSALRNENNVYSVTQGQVARKLNDLGLHPQISSRDTSWYTTWRACEASGRDYAFLLNDGSDSAGNATFTTTKRPFSLDPWTGQRTPVSHYILGDNSVTIPLVLAPNQVKVFVFEAGEHECHLTSAPPSILATKLSKTEVVVHSHTVGEVSSSSGKRHALAPALSPFPLLDWNLTVSHWERPADLYDVETPASVRNTTHTLSSAILPSWTEISGLEDVSGVGYYTARFPWSSSNNMSGAYISFPPVAHAITVWVNGHLMPSPDHRAPLLHATPYLQQGYNEVLAIVPSTMWNYLRTILADLRSADEQASLITRLGGRLP